MPGTSELSDSATVATQGQHSGSYGIWYYFYFALFVGADHTTGKEAPTRQIHLTLTLTIDLGCRCQIVYQGEARGRQLPHDLALAFIWLQVLTSLNLFCLLSVLWACCCVSTTLLNSLIAGLATLKACELWYVVKFIVE